ncbi:hypothetical protein, partial [Hominenteromicrobium sp.]|uniref:hypothetical protein n=1 Tax=Hominenteromicrobium sp. TaxID=3073581 RepID=UPI003A91CF5C
MTTNEADGLYGFFPINLCGSAPKFTVCTAAMMSSFRDKRLAVQCVVFGFIRRGEEMLALHAQGAYFFIVHYGFPFVSARHIRHCSTRAPC